MLHRIPANHGQIVKLYERHFQPIFKTRWWGKLLTMSRIIHREIRYDYEDNMGFLTLVTRSGKMLQCQVRNGKCCFIGITGFGIVSYDINGPIDYEPFSTFLQEELKKAETSFWGGTKI